MNTLIFVIILGIIQGLTEFLPVSSSGHLALLENLNFFKDFSSELSQQFSLLAFNVLLHIGTILAVLFFWQKDIFHLIKTFFADLKSKRWKGEGFRMANLMFFSLIPLLGAPFIKHYVENVTESLRIVAVLFVINGTMLVLSDRLFKKRGAKHSEITQMSSKSALSIGIFQALAVFPGISRSGSTITAGLIFGLNGKESVRYSFLISIPVLLAAAFLEGVEIYKHQTNAFGDLPWEWVITGILASFSAGIFSMKVLVWLGRKTLFYPFGIYTILLGCLIIFLGY